MTVYYFILAFLLGCSKIIILAFSIILLNSYTTGFANNQPIAKNGILDLRGWDFEEDGNVKLVGEWEYYWEKLLKPSDFDKLIKPKLSGYAKVPGSLEGYKVDGKILDGNGYTTYCLKLKLNKANQNLSLNFNIFIFSYIIYINGQKVKQVGKPSEKKEDSFEQVSQENVIDFVNKDELFIIINISDFKYRELGIPSGKMELGLSPVIHNQRERKIANNYLVQGIILFLAFYHLIIYFLRKNDKVYLLFTIMCISMLFQDLASGLHYLLFYPDIFNFLPLGTFFVCFIITINIYCILILKLFSYEFKKSIMIIYLLLSIITALSILIIGLIYINIIWKIYMIISLVMLVYVIYVIFTAFKHKREGSGIFFVGIIILLLLFIEYIFHLTGFKTSGKQFEILILLIQSLVLTVRFTNSLNTVEQQSAELKKHKENLEEIVIERTNQLNDQNLELTVLNENLAVKNIQVESEKEKSDRLLLNVLPEQIAERLKLGETTIADHFDEASVIFIDIVDFTKTSASTSAKRVADVLNTLYSKLDQIAKKHGLEKIKTIGDCYMAAAGIPVADPDNAVKAAKFAIEAMEMLKDYDTGDGTILNFRCGVDCGPVVAGVIGEHKFIYDVWGDTVNTAARMEEYSEPGKIQVTERFKETLSHPMTGSQRMTFEERGEIEIKGKGLMRTWFLENKFNK